MPFEIRGAELEDAPVIVTLVRRSYRGEASRRGWTSGSKWIEGLRTDEDHIRNFINKSASVVLVGEQAGVMLGCCHVEHRGRICHLGMLAVDPNHQSHGFGGQLVLKAEATAQKWGMEGMQIVVLDRQPELALWYSRRGYVKTGERMPYPADERFGRPTVQDLYFETLSKTL